MEDIYLDRSLSNEMISRTLSEIFPELKVFYFDIPNEKPAALDYDNSGHIIFSTYFSADKVEFGFIISIYRTPDSHSQQRQLYIGKMFSSYCRCRVLVPFIKPDEPHNPYYDVIFENDKTFIADDSDTNFADGTEWLLKNSGEYLLKDIQFDHKGQFITNE